MSRVLEVLNSTGGFLSGYLPSLTNLRNAFPTFVQKTCRLEDQETGAVLPAMAESRWTHPSSRDPKGFYQAAKSVWAEGGKEARALCILHAMDYACWKDLPDGIPLMCQEVYAQPTFHDSLLLSFPSL